MAKLNKQELSAIAADIYEKVNAPINEYNELISSDRAFKEWKIVFDRTAEGKELAKLYTTLESLKESFKDYKCYRYGNNNVVTVSTSGSLEEVKKYLFKKAITTKPNVGDKYLIERELIIAQAKNTDVDAMIASILEKYK